MKGKQKFQLINFYHSPNVIIRYYMESLVCEDFYMSESKMGPYTGGNFVEDLRRNYSGIEWFKNQSTSWNDNQTPAFTEILTKRGLSYNFNQLEPKKLFTNVVSDQFLNPPIIEMLNSKNKLSIVDYPIYAMNDKGFKIEWRKNPHLKYVCKEATFVVHSPFEMPDLYDKLKFCEIYYGKSLEILIIPEVKYTSEDLKDLKPEERGCYFEDERSLQLFQVYTRKNCEMECMINYTNIIQRCVPYFFVRTANTTVCGSDESTILLEKIANYLNDLDEQSKCLCLDQCNSIDYNIEIIDTKIADEEVVEMSFRFKDNEFIPFIRKQQFKLVDFLSQCGGLMGFFAGASALSIIELLYFMTLRVCSNLIRMLIARRATFDVE